jgi:hypothetical protein
MTRCITSSPFQCGDEGGETHQEEKWLLFFLLLVACYYFIIIVLASYSLLAVISLYVVVVASSTSILIITKPLLELWCLLFITPSLNHSPISTLISVIDNNQYPY